MSLDVNQLKAMAAKVKAKEDPKALLDGCRFVRRVDPDDARFMTIEIRAPNPAMAGGACDPSDLGGEEAVREFLVMCVETARSAGLK